LQVAVTSSGVVGSCATTVLGEAAPPVPQAWLADVLARIAAPNPDIVTGTTIECTVRHMASLCLPPDLVGQLLCDHNRRQVRVGRTTVGHYRGIDDPQPSGPDRATLGWRQ
jgi:hypothetical protein